MRLCGYAAGRDIWHLGLANRRWWNELHTGDHWNFESLALDGEKHHNPEGVFAQVRTEGVLALSLSNMGLSIWKSLESEDLPRLETLRVSECVVQQRGAQVLAKMIRRSGFRELTLRNCFLDEREIAVLGPAMSVLTTLAIVESSMLVQLTPTLFPHLQGSGSLREISIHGRFALTSQDVAGLASSAGSHLRVLRLQENALLRDDTMQELCSRISKGYLPLEVLDVSANCGGSLSDVTGTALAKCLQGGWKLRSLDVRGHQLTLASVAEILAHGAALLHTDFTGNDLGERDYIKELHAASTSSQLQLLRLGGGGHQGCLSMAEDVDGDESEAKVRGFVCDMSWSAGLLATLSCLDISQASMDDVVLDTLAAAISSATSLALRRLDLSSNFVTEVGVASLLAALRSHRPTLRRLDVGSNGIGTSGAMDIFSALLCGGALATLEELALRSNAISDTSALCKALPFSRLCSVDLRENCLQDAEVRKLLSVQQSSTASRLCSISFAGNDLSEELLFELNLLEPDEAEAVKQRLLRKGKAHPSQQAEDAPRSSDGASALQEEQVSVSLADAEGVDHSPFSNEPLRLLNDGSGLDATPMISKEEWQDCIDSIKWMEQQLQR
mmetsp:Transcript_60825/g.144946  ORF Transcript_60825/g.144946 Transcript_60825/m.144946 type:complete len:615 (-) Transcript_60825:11-1855(-)